MRFHDKPRSKARMSRWDAIKLSLADVCQNSSIHGLRYLAEGSALSRYIWSAALCTSASTMVTCMGLLWSQYAAGTTEFNLLSTRSPMHMRPFPAVYLCPQPTFSEDAIRAAVIESLLLTEPLSQVEETGVKAVGEMLELMRYPNWYFLEPVLKQVSASFGNRLTEINSLQLEPILRKAFRNCSEQMVNCWWHAVPTVCSDIFEVQHRIDQWCYVFNSRFSDRQHHHKCLTDPNCALRYGTASGTGSGLRVMLKAEHKVAQMKISAHSPHSLPLPWSDDALRILPGQDIRVQLAVSATLNDESIDDIPEDMRGCRDISFRRSNYSQTECVEDYVYQEVKKSCGCVPVMINIAMRRRLASVNKDKICSFPQFECMYSFISGARGVAFRARVDMACLPSCSEVAYSQTVKLSPSDSEKLLKNCPQCVLIEVTFKTPARGVAYERRRTVSKQAFYLSSSGLLGLLLGCSILLVAEIAYFAVRLLKVLVFGS